MSAMVSDEETPGEARDAPTAPATADAGAIELPPAETARYLLLERMGAGGMGVVYAAYDRVLDRKVAYKVLREGLLGGRNQERLLREAQAMAKLAHPNVVPVFDAGEHAGTVFLVMELVQGETVAEWCRTPRTVLEIAAVFQDAARGLAAMHAAGLVHRDVKPSNLLVDQGGRGRIADLGLARGAGEPAAESAGGGADDLQLSGTPPYLAPEQLRGDRTDARADQFALCVSLFEALYGELPFPAGPPAERLAAIDRGPRPSKQPIPEWLAAALARGLAADPSVRFPDLHALAAALTPPPRWWRRWWPAAAAVLAAAGVAAAVLASRSATPPPRAPTCDDVIPDLGDAWSPARRAAVTAAVASTPDSRAAPERLDAYAARWRHARAIACDAGLVARAWPAGLVERAAVCLDRGRRELRGVASAIASADARAHQRAVELVAGLWPPTACGDPDYLATHVEAARDPAAAARRDALSVRLVERELSLGGLDEVSRRLAELGPAVDASGDVGLASRLASLRAGLARDRNDLAAAGRYQTDAYVLARSARDPEATAHAAAALVWHHGYFQEDLGRARDWGRIASAEAVALGDDPAAAGLHHALGVLADRQGEPEAALAHFHRAVELTRRHHGDDHHITAAMLGAEATALGVVGRRDEAIARQLEAIAITERWFGPDALRLAGPLQNLALTESEAGRHKDAEAHARRAVAIGERHATSAERRGNGLLALASALSNGFHEEEALPYLERARAAFTAAGLPGVAGQCQVDAGIARTALATRRGDVRLAELALRDLRAGRAAMTAAWGATHVEVRRALAAEADALVAARRCPEAERVLAAAIGGRAMSAIPASERAGIVGVRAECAAQRGQHDERLAAITELVALWTERGDAIRLAGARADRGLALLALGRLDEARAELTAARPGLDPAVQPTTIERVDRALARLAPPARQP
jgi:tetratricopeptide (TPR) repeat protein